MIKKLQRRFVISSMSAVSILLILLLTALNVISFAVASKQSDGILDALIENEVSPRPIPPFGNEHGGFFEPHFNENTRLSSIFFTARTDGEGNIKNIDTGRIGSIEEKEARELVYGVIQKGKTMGDIDNFRFDSRTTSENGSIYLFLDISSQKYSALRLILISVIVFTVSLILMLVLLIFLSKRAIKPIAESIERQKHFITNAGHELKTPLAIISANTDALELMSGESKWSENIRAQTVRLSKLMQRLLTLSRLDEMNVKETMEPFSISELLKNMLCGMSESAEQKGLETEEKIESGIFINANRDMTEMLFSVLLDNAFKYSSTEGKIEISLLRDEKKLYFEIINEVDSLPECAPERLFDRFYRADKARTQKNGGYGIGLSAAREAAELHGGSISAKYIGENKISFKVIMPIIS